MPRPRPARVALAVAAPLAGVGLSAAPAAAQVAFLSRTSSGSVEGTATNTPASTGSNDFSADDTFTGPTTGGVQLLQSATSPDGTGTATATVDEAGAVLNDDGTFFGISTAATVAARRDVATDVIGPTGAFTTDPANATAASGELSADFAFRVDSPQPFVLTGELFNSNNGFAEILFGPAGGGIGDLIFSNGVTGDFTSDLDTVNREPIGFRGPVTGVLQPGEYTLELFASAPASDTDGPRSTAGYSVSLQFVPEPTGVATVGGLAAVALGRRRRSAARA